MDTPTRDRTTAYQCRCEVRNDSVPDLWIECNRTALPDSPVCDVCEVCQTERPAHTVRIRIS